ncbi:serine--tRNA ligase [Thermoplasmatales archaeon ex4572_165]|nr:MAG: serine--tRNA ligase [Thermoplasmatales archaeon ex4572_165]RLF59956.1 MAG: serine--tRNA ligase [Thermoplasmata archaeon]
MLDIKLIREEPELVRKNLEKRKKPDYNKMLNDLITKDEAWRNIKIEVDALRQKRNQLTNSIKSLKKEGKTDQISQVLNEAKQIPDKIKNLEKKQLIIESERNSLLLTLPNLLHETVPYGEDDSGNMVEKTGGSKQSFSFTPRSHIDIVEGIKGADIERAAKTSGARFYFLMDELVQLEFAIIQHAIKLLTKRGYHLVVPPTLVKGKIMEGGGFLPTYRDDVYKIEDEDLFLVGTSEAPLVGMHANEILYQDDFPIRYAGFSTCFRTEAGAHGKDTKGIFRTHHFEKIEQISITNPENSWKEHDYLFETAEMFWQSLEIPYRKVNICTGDIGLVAAKKFDLEGWYPSQNAYRELVSTSNCTDFQARRLKIRFREKDGMPTKICHTLNSTVIAIQRGLTCILENNQKEDGSIKVPKVLQQYVDFKEITPKI